MVICSMCNEEKGDDFRKNRTVCRICDNFLARQKRIRDKDKIKPEFIICNVCLQKKTEFHVNNRKCLDCKKEQNKLYRRTTDKAKIWVQNNKERMSKLHHNFYVKNKQKICDKNRSRNLMDLNYKLVISHRSAIRQFINKKSNNSKYVNCSGEMLINWVAYQFIEDMTLENYGTVWNIDNFLPIKLFLEDKLKKEIVLNWINIKPVLKKYNLKKNQYTDKNQCKIHLDNIINYFKIHKIQVDNFYLHELKNYC